jgi:putative phosphoribosyl transferase
MRYRNRQEAGINLASRLVHLRGSDPLVLGLPRGGVVVAAEVARELDAPLDVILVRKLGVPFQPELAMGAIAEGGIRILDPSIVGATRLSDAEIARIEKRELQNLSKAAERFRHGRSPQDMSGRVVVIVDDGIATGATVLAACEVARRRAVSKLVVAAPVGSTTALDRIRLVADEVVCPASDRFLAISQYYDHFRSVADDEVRACLDEAAERMKRSGPATVD